MIRGRVRGVRLNERGVNIWISAPAAILIGAGTVRAAQHLIYTPFGRRGTTPIAMVIVALGMTLILEFGTQALAGPTNVSYIMRSGSNGQIGSIELTVVQLVIIGLSIVVMSWSTPDQIHAAGQGDASDCCEPQSRA